MDKIYYNFGGRVVLITLGILFADEKGMRKIKTPLISSVVITAVFVLIGTGLLFVREDMFSDYFQIRTQIR